MFLKGFVEKRRSIFVFTIIVAIGAFLVQYLHYIQIPDSPKTVQGSTRRIFTSDELSQYNGINSDSLFLSIIGTVFDVSKGAKYYGKDGSYRYFTGKDATRGMVTGDFKDKTSNKDYVLDLSCDNLFSILNWRHTFKEKYKTVGVLVGRYYKDNGDETDYMKQFKTKLKKCRLEKENEKKIDQMYPPCNIAWSEQESTRVWCTKSSGGVERDWVGVPRQLYTPGEEKPRCVCINTTMENTSLLKEYDGCPHTSEQCFISNN